MSTRRHKRRRIERDPELVLDDLLPGPSSPARGPEEAAADPEPPEQAPEEQLQTDGEAFAKEQEIWEAFREEHYEGAPHSRLPHACAG